MSEFVLALPLLMLVLALLFYFGSLAVRVQQGNAMARYEVWRAAMDGLGPAAKANGEAEELNAAFFPDQPSTAERVWSVDHYPEAAYQQWLNTSEAESADAGRLAWAWIYKRNGGHRQPRGLGQRFAVFHEQAADSWGQIAAAVGQTDEANPERTALRRGQHRIDSDWPYVDDWRAAFPHWRADLAGSAAAVEVTRDAFLEPLDLMLESEARGQGWRTGREAGRTLPGLMRTFYLTTPRYRGPIVEP